MHAFVNNLPIFANCSAVVAQLYQKWYSYGMTYYDDIYEHAVDNYYLITTGEAAEIGAPGIELAKLAHRGKLENLARGLYRLARYVPSEFDPYAIAVAKVGPEAYLYGESVLALLNLAPTNPTYMCVATPKRVRKRLPKSFRVYRVEDGNALTMYEGIRSQKVKDAIVACRKTMMDDRLQEAALRARERGYITAKEEVALKEEMKW